jgi:miniconductance mechanosensitive channel
MEGNWLYDLLHRKGLAESTSEWLSILINAALVVLVLVVATLIIRRILLRVSRTWIKANRYRWDDALLRNNFLDRLSWFIPILLAHLSIDALLPVESTAYLILKRMMMLFFVIAGVTSVTALLATVSDVYRNIKPKQADVLQGFLDAGKIITYIIGVIFAVSIFSGMSPWGIISVLGGMTAVTMLVFKDTILGFAASIQLTATDMVRVGDWVEMPSYGADGDVISISIHTIRVQNWDKTITTIPTYSLVTSSFKNWRGMSESGGRRIKRALMLDVNSIRFCDQELFERLSGIRLLSDYLQAKQQEITEYNRTRQLEPENDLGINGRRQTNIGIFRAYVVAYLKDNPLISRNMTFLVRQLAQTEYGLPLEIYVFSTDQRWVQYEKIQSDIFDHLFAALPVFDLRPFQNPTGYDIQHLSQAPEVIS